MQYWEEFERILTAYMKIALLGKWDYPIIDKQDDNNVDNEDKKIKRTQIREV